MLVSEHPLSSRYTILPFPAAIPNISPVVGLIVAMPIFSDFHATIEAGVCVAVNITRLSTQTSFGVITGTGLIIMVVVAESTQPWTSLPTTLNISPSEARVTIGCSRLLLNFAKRFEDQFQDITSVAVSSKVKEVTLAQIGPELVAVTFGLG